MDADSVGGDGPFAPLGDGKNMHDRVFTSGRRERCALCDVRCAMCDVRQWVRMRSAGLAVQGVR